MVPEFGLTVQRTSTPHSDQPVYPVNSVELRPFTVELRIRSESISL
ncbi:hypothetical protein [Ilyomonas limi]|nr:hypothetical protein [Ilyomonas limi]